MAVPFILFCGSLLFYMILGSNPCATNSGKLRKALLLEIANNKRQNESIGKSRKSILFEITNNRILNASINSHQMKLEIANDRKENKSNNSHEMELIMEKEYGKRNHSNIT